VRRAHDEICGRVGTDWRASLWAIEAARGSAVGAVHRKRGTRIDALRGLLLRSGRLLGGCKHLMRVCGEGGEGAGRCTLAALLSSPRTLLALPELAVSGSLITVYPTSFFAVGTV